MKACENHDNAVVVYDELMLRKGCPLCRKQRDFSKLETKFDELEQENARLTEKLAQVNCKEE